MRLVITEEKFVRLLIENGADVDGEGMVRWKGKLHML